MAIDPPVGAPRYIKFRWIMAFVVFAAISVAAKFKQDASFEAKVTGGDNYCFIGVRPMPDGALKAQIKNDMGRVPSVAYGIYRASDNGNWEPYSPWFGSGPCFKTSIDLPIFLKPGRYRVDFMGSNFDWHQYLEITTNGEKRFFLTMWIKRDDGEILRPKATTQIGN